MRLNRATSGGADGGSTPALPRRHVRWAPHDMASLSALALLVTGMAVFVASASSTEEMYMAVHVVAATVWVGGGTALLVFGVRSERARDMEALAKLVRHLAWVGLRVFTPASLVTLGSGIALVEKSGIGYGSFWIDFSLAVWALSFLTGLVYLGPRSERVARLIAERGAHDPVTVRAVEALLRVARFDETMLLLVVVVMAAKPVF